MFVKICGITTPEEALLALDKGATHIGVVFAERSQRRVTIEQAKEIGAVVKGAGGLLVGVFEEQPIEAIAREVPLDLVQLHRCDRVDLPCIYAVGYGEAAPAGFDPERDYLLFDNAKAGSGETPERAGFVCPPRAFLSGGLTAENVRALIERFAPLGVDVSSGVESEPGVKDPAKIAAFLQAARPGYFGKFGGLFVPELLIEPLRQLGDAFETMAKSKSFQDEFLEILKNYAGRPTALTEVPRFAKSVGRARIFLKREDLLHTGAHKLNNAIGQCLLAKKMGKKRIIAETGAGQHGLATATACAFLDLECVVYMGRLDMERQAPNVSKMRLLGAEIIGVDAGSKTLKDAVNEALRDWAESFESSHYCLGSALGPHPFPSMVAQFQSIIGQEAKEQFFLRVGKDPDLAVACVGGGSNAIGLFSAYLATDVPLVGVEAAGLGKGKSAARFAEGSPGALHGSFSYVLQSEEGQIKETHSISAGLDYPGVGPHHAQLFESCRVVYDSALDDEALAAFSLLSRTEGIIPALESSHALAYAMRIAPEMPEGSCILINLSGRGDKDLPQLLAKGLVDG